MSPVFLAPVFLLVVVCVRAMCIVPECQSPSFVSKASRCGRCCVLLFSHSKIFLGFCVIFQVNWGMAEDAVEVPMKDLVQGCTSFCGRCGPSLNYKLCPDH